MFRNSDRVCVEIHLIKDFHFETEKVSARRRAVISLVDYTTPEDVIICSD